MTEHPYLVHSFFRDCPCQSDICHLILTLFSWFNDSIKIFLESPFLNNYQWQNNLIWSSSALLDVHVSLTHVIKPFLISWFTNFIILFWLRPVLLEITYDRTNLISCTKVNMYHGNHVTTILLNILMHTNSLWSVFHPLVQAGETFIASSFCLIF